MTEQELLQENQKLQARLAKAVEVFKEQKADIARLTEERDSEKAANEKLQVRVDELEKKTATMNEQDSQFFEQVQEIENLKALVSEKDAELVKADENLQATKKAAEDAAATAEKEYAELSNQHKQTVEAWNETKANAKEALRTLAALLK